MGSEWPLVTIEDLQAVHKGAIAIGPFGSRMKSDCYVESGIPVIRGTNITGGSDLDGEFVFISEEMANSLGACNVYQNDLVFPHRGSIGEVGIITDNRRYVISSSLMKLTCDETKAYPKFIYYFFKSPIGKYELLKNSSQVGTPGIGQPLSSLKSITLRLPPLEIQGRIIKLLSGLDNKILINSQINQTLEQMAQTLFKSWFVDFDPVIDNALDAGNAIPDTLQERAEQRRQLRAKADFKPLPAATRALFPSEFEETELGWVPKGWVYCRLVDIASISSGKRPPTKSDEKDGENFIPVWGGNGIKWFTNQYLFNNKYIITGRVGTLGTVYKVDGLSWPSDNALVINPHNKDCFEFIYQHLSNTDIESLNSGSTQPLVTQTALGNVDVLLPNGVDILSLFQCQTGMFDRKITENMLQIECLSSLRNELLPKLISGELALDDLPEDISEVAEAF